MSVGLHHRAADAEACLAVEEATFNNIDADEIDARAENPRQKAGFLAAFVVRQCAQFGEVELLLAESLGCVPRIVQQVAAQQGLLRLALVVQPLVDKAFPLGKAAPPDTDFGLGIESATLYPPTAVVVQAFHGKNLVLGDFSVFQCFDGLFQLVGERFIGVNGEDEVADGEFVGEVFLVGVAEPVLAEELHAITVADGLGRIGGMRVNNDDLVRNILNGIKALRDFLLLVEGDDDDRKCVHVFKISAKVGFFSYFCGLFLNNKLEFGKSQKGIEG